MKVLQVGKYYPPYRGGMESHLQDLCQELKRHIDLEVLVSNDQAEEQREELEGIAVTRLGRQWNILGNPINLRLWTHMRRTDADVVHIHWPNPVALLVYWLSRCKAKLVVTYHSDIVRQRFAWGFLEPLMGRILRRSILIVTSPNYADSSPFLKKHASSCRIVPLGIDMERVKSNDEKLQAHMRERFGPRMILGAGRHIYYKGFQYAVEAMKSVDGHLVIVGDGPLRVELEAQARQIGVETKVTFLGSVEQTELNALYAVAKVFVLPSIARSEAFGLVQVEAMANATPVVNTSLDSGVPYVSPHNETGLTVEPGNSKELADALNRLLDNHFLRERLGNAAKQRVIELFTLEEMARRTLAVYREVLAEPGKRSQVAVRSFA